MNTLTGLELRSVLVVVLLDAASPRTVSDLVEALRGAGFDLGARPGKAVSDALRWEVRRGRVVRLGRGRYGPGSMPKSTAWDIRRRASVVLAGGAGAWYSELWRRRLSAMQR